MIIAQMKLIHYTVIYGTVRASTFSPGLNRTLFIVLLFSPPLIFPPFTFSFCLVSHHLRGDFSSCSLLLLFYICQLAKYHV